MKYSTQQAAAPAVQVCILKNWQTHLVERSLEAVAQWLRDNPGPADKPKGDANAVNLIWLATPASNASNTGNVKYSAQRGYDLETTDGAFFDIDGKATTEASFSRSLVRLEELGLGFIYSPSHHNSSEEPWRGHIQIVFSGRCRAADHQRLWRYIHDEIFPDVDRSQSSPARGRNAPVQGRDVQVFPGALLDVQAWLARIPPEPTRECTPPLQASPTQDTTHDAAIGDQLVSVWGSNSGHRAFAGLGGMLRDRRVSFERAVRLAEYINDRASMPHDNPEERIEQAFEGEHDCGVPKLKEGLRSGWPVLSLGPENYDRYQTAIDLVVDQVECWILTSVKPAPANDTETSTPEAGPAPKEPPHAPEPPGFFRDLDWRQPLGDVPWLCRGLDLVQGRPAILVAKDGRGKSWLAQALAVAVASGKPAFGHFAVQRPGKVVHIDIDQGGYLTAKRYQQLVAGVGDASAPVRVVTTTHKLISEGAATALIALCTGVVLCIVDNLRNASDAEENDSSFANPLRMMQQVSDRTGCTFLVLHHEPKDAEDNADTTRVLRGTGAIPAAASAVWRLTRTPGGPAKVSHIRGAGYQALLPRFCLELRGGEEHDETAALVWLPDAEDGISARGGADPHWGLRIDRAVSIVRDQPGISKNRLKAALGGNRETTDAILEALEVGLPAAGGERLWSYPGPNRAQLYFAAPADDLVLGALATPQAAVAIARATMLPPKVVQDSTRYLHSQGRILEMTVGGEEGWMLAPGRK